MDIGQLFGTFLPALEGAPWLRAALAIVLVFFLPGFAWTLVFFDREGKGQVTTGVMQPAQLRQALLALGGS